MALPAAPFGALFPDFASSDLLSSSSSGIGPISPCARFPAAACGRLQLTELGFVAAAQFPRSICFP
jgi:hypothetical protein